MKQRVYEILYRELVENYANSKGRTNTADFWLTISAISFVYGLIICITGLATYIPYGFLYAVSIGGGVLVVLSILLCLPKIMLMARRLRDSNNDPMLMILLLVPFLGWLALLYLFCKRTSPISNELEEKRSVSGLFIVSILVLGCLATSAGSTMINHNFMVEETAYGNLEPSSLTKQANRLLQSETATTEGRTVVSNYYEALNKKDYHSAYRYLSARAMERYGTFELWEQAMNKEAVPKVKAIQLDYVSQDQDDDIVVNYMGFTVTFEDNLEPLLVRLHNEGKGWGIVAIEAAEED
jgi:uncharacterized membrane protein YhaH (DUF805 family)